MPRQAHTLFETDASPPGAHAPGLIYAVGDVHGRLDLLSRLVDRVAGDVGPSPATPPTIILLGDVIDRGADSRGCLDRLVGLQAQSWCRLILLRGNHEQMLLDFLADPERGRAWVGAGGDATLLSYGLSGAKARSWRDLRDAFAEALPPAHRLILERTRPLVRLGDYLFVHAGVRPGTSIEDQQPIDLLTIRGPFLRADRACDQVVVHGHSPSAEAVLTPWRIGLDTGAYASGLLSAVKLTGSTRELIQTR